MSLPKDILTPSHTLSWETQAQENLRRLTLWLPLQSTCDVRLLSYGYPYSLHLIVRDLYAKRSTIWLPLQSTNCVKCQSCGYPTIYTLLSEICTQQKFVLWCKLNLNYPYNLLSQFQPINLPTYGPATLKLQQSGYCDTVPTISALELKKRPNIWPLAKNLLPQFSSKLLVARFSLQIFAITRPLSKNHPNDLETTSKTYTYKSF